MAKYQSSTHFNDCAFPSRDLGKIALPIPQAKLAYFTGRRKNRVGEQGTAREEHTDCETLKKFKLMLLEFRSLCLTQFKSRITFKEYVFPLSYDTYFLLMYHIAATADMNV